MTWLGPDANFLALEEPHCHPDRAGVVILQAPYEATSTFGEGSAAGPGAVLAASHEVELFDAQLGCEAWMACGGIATCAPLDVTGKDGADVAAALETDAAGWLDRGKFVITLGGEHTSTVGAAWAHAARGEDVTVLQLDAHSDLRAAYLDQPWNHACAMARVLDRCGHLVQVGIRSEAAEERDTVRAGAIPVHYAHAIHDAEAAREDWIAAVVGDTRRRVYVTFDCDVFDPAVMPATGTPEPDGLTWRQVDRLLARLCREREVVGFDLSELAPVAGLHHPQFTAAKLLYRFLGYRFGG